MGEASRNLDSFHKAGFRSQLVLAGSSDLSTCHKVRMFKVFKSNRDLGFVQVAGVRLPNSQAELFQCEAERKDWTGIFEKDVTVRLDG